MINTKGVRTTKKKKCAILNYATHKKSLMGYDRDLELTKTKNVKTESGVYIFEKLDRERQIKKMHATLLDQDSDYESLR